MPFNRLPGRFGSSTDDAEHTTESELDAVVSSKIQTVLTEQQIPQSTTQTSTGFEHYSELGGAGSEGGSLTPTHDDPNTKAIYSYVTAEEDGRALKRGRLHDIELETGGTWSCAPTIWTGSLRADTLSQCSNISTKQIAIGTNQGLTIGGTQIFTDADGWAWPGKTALGDLKVSNTVTVGSRTQISDAGFFNSTGSVQSATGAFASLSSGNINVTGGLGAGSISAGTVTCTGLTNNGNSEVGGDLQINGKLLSLQDIDVAGGAQFSSSVRVRGEEVVASKKVASANVEVDQTTVTGAASPFVFSPVTVYEGEIDITRPSSQYVFVAYVLIEASDRKFVYTDLAELPTKPTAPPKPVKPDLLLSGEPVHPDPGSFQNSNDFEAAVTAYSAELLAWTTAQREYDNAYHDYVDALTVRDELYQVSLESWARTLALNNAANFGTSGVRDKIGCTLHLTIDGVEQQRTVWLPRPNVTGITSGQYSGAQTKLEISFDHKEGQVSVSAFWSSGQVVTQNADPSGANDPENFYNNKGNQALQFTTPRTSFGQGTCPIKIAARLDTGLYNTLPEGNVPRFASGNGTYRNTRNNTKITFTHQHLIRY